MLTTNGSGLLTWTTVAGTGTVTGPVSSTDNAMVRWDGTGGIVIQNSGVVVDDSNNITGVNTLTISRASGTTACSDTITDAASVGTVSTFTNAASGGNTLSLNVGATGNTLGANKIFLGDNSAYRLGWDTSSGNVGVGTTSPATFKLQVAGAVGPDSNDAGALGSGALSFSDLFLASGAVINFNNGNYTITHTAGLLTTNGNLSLTTSGVLTTGTIELGAASDTTISRSAAGVIAVEGVPLYSNIPQNSQSAAYTTVLADAQKHILHPTADNNARTFTIDSNANVAYPVGTAITFVNQINTVTIAITSDTMTLAGTGTTGSRTLAANGMATALKIATTSWMISGTGLT